MKQKNSIALVAIRGIVSFALVFILLCSASCKKDDSTEFNKKIKPGFSEKASKSWKKGFFPEPKQSEESEEESDKTDIEERTAATGRITAKPTDETTVTTSEITTRQLKRLQLLRQLKQLQLLTNSNNYNCSTNYHRIAYCQSR